MGLLAFKMDVFEEARSAAMSAPRVTSTIFVGDRGSGRRTESEDRAAIKSGVDEFVSAIESWRVGAIAATARAKTELQKNYSLLITFHMEKLASDLDRHMATLEEFREDTNAKDKAVIKHLQASAEEAAIYSPSGGRFLRRELRRIVEACERRQKTLLRNLQQMLEMQGRLREIARRESLPAPNFESDEERDAYVQKILSRPPDIEGSRDRAQRLLARFPRTAAYLAR